MDKGYKSFETHASRSLHCYEQIVKSTSGEAQNIGSEP
jgi:hypothetical protein